MRQIETTPALLIGGDEMIEGLVSAEELRAAVAARKTVADALAA
jgi:hypothetical protein